MPPLRESETLRETPRHIKAGKHEEEAEVGANDLWGLRQTVAVARVQWVLDPINQVWVEEHILPARGFGLEAFSEALKDHFTSGAMQKMLNDESALVKLLDKKF